MTNLSYLLYNSFMNIVHIRNGTLSINVKEVDIVTKYWIFYTFLCKSVWDLGGMVAQFGRISNSVKFGENYVGQIQLHSNTDRGIKALTQNLSLKAHPAALYIK